MVYGLGPYHTDLREGGEEGVGGLLAGARLHVAGVTLRTAVLAVGTANGLRRRNKGLLLNMKNT